MPSTSILSGKFGVRMNKTLLRWEFKEIPGEVVIPSFLESKINNPSFYETRQQWGNPDGIKIISLAGREANMGTRFHDVHGAEIRIYGHLPEIVALIVPKAHVFKEVKKGHIPSESEEIKDFSLIFKDFGYTQHLLPDKTGDYWVGYLKTVLPPPPGE